VKYRVVAVCWRKLSAARRIEAASRAEAEAIALKDLKPYGLLDRKKWETCAPIDFAPEIEREGDLASPPVDEAEPSTSAFLCEVEAELARARFKFPSPFGCLAALTEEVGEVAQAVLKHAAGKGGKQHIYEEAVQVAAMAARVATEGDPSLYAGGYIELAASEPEIAVKQE
jgi:hypothetical protein